MSLDKFTEMYLDWFNNFLTVERFAEYYEINVEQAQQIINLGREIGSLELVRVEH